MRAAVRGGPQVRSLAGYRLTAGPGGPPLAATADVGLFYSFTGFSVGSLSAVDQYSVYVRLEEPGLAAAAAAGVSATLEVAGLTDEAGNVMVPERWPVAHDADTPSPLIKARGSGGGGGRGGGREVAAAAATKGRGGGRGGILLGGGSGQLTY